MSGGPRGPFLGALLLLPLATGCIDNTVTAKKFNAIAVVLGDFDDMADLLTTNEIGWAGYDGFIVQATYEPANTRLVRGELALSVEGLLLDSSGTDDLGSFNAVFVNSGVRGLNAVQYNDMLQPDNSLLADPTDLQHTCDFVHAGGTLVVSDWAYDLVEFCWPDAIDFYGENTETDAGQVGIASNDVLATIDDTALQTSMGTSLSLNYNYSAWAVMQSAGPDTTVLISGNAPYQPSATKLEDELPDVPMMVRFEDGRGQVVFSSFHWAAQSPAVSSALLFGAVDGIASGDGTGSATSSGGDSGAS